MAEAIIRLPDVRARTGLSRSEIYRRESLNQFPKRVTLGARSVGWVAAEIESWIQERIRASRPQQSSHGQKAA
jgi:prophage regulatory protein